MIMFLLVAQAGEAFAVSSMACFDSGRGTMTSENMMMSENMGPRSTVGKVTENAMQTVESMQMMNHDCCQQDCECPLGMLSLAVLIDINVQVATHQSDEQLVDTDSSLVFTFIPSQQRPPKYLSDFAG